MIDPKRLEALGIREDPAGGYLRSRPRNVNPEFDPSDPHGLQGLLVAYDRQDVPHPVILPVALDKASVEEARQKALASGADFYHPQHGWLRGGRKRETEAPENLGSGSVVYPSTRIRVTAQKER